jgi:uncharacterized RDD family membrane protein YckC
VARPLAFFLLLTSVLAYLIGISSPVATVIKETLVTHETQQYSILSSISTLYSSGEVFLAVLIAAFSILFPITKYLTMLTVLLSSGDPEESGTFRLVRSLGKWSMLDVFVVALLIVMARINAVDHWYLATSMKTEAGLFIYAFSVVSSMILAARIGAMKSNMAMPIELPNGRIVRPCGFWIRLWASVIDGVFGAAIIFPIMFKIYGPGYFQSEEVIQGGADFVFNWILPLVVTIAFWTIWQATPGKLMIGARIVDARTGARVPLGRLFGRYAGYYLSLLPIGLGIVWVALDSRRQGWHDKVARTLVVEAD